MGGFRLVNHVHQSNAPLLASSLGRTSQKTKEYMCVFLKLLRRVRFRRTNVLASTSPVIDHAGTAAMKRTSAESPRVVSDINNGIKFDFLPAEALATSLIILSSEENSAKLRGEFILFLISEKIKLALLWVGAARSAY